MIPSPERAAGAVRLPEPDRSRWQPLRTGLVDLFLYDYEEFWFRDGHLLLRGNNGTGKSKVLALTLPFLLDARLDPWRVEPDGDRLKRMEWNLLLDGVYEERLGYTWLELGRLDAEGNPHHFTIGCGMKAVRGRGIQSRWFFTTRRRVGLDLWLTGPTGSALTRERLIEALGERGIVHDTAEAHRRAVDEHLFHLGEHRYEALMDLLIQLRQPQLSRRPDAEKLSAALAEALAPLDQAVLSDLASAFHDLQEQRDDLHELESLRNDVGRFVESYRRYAAVAARRQAAEVRATYSAHERARTEQTAAGADLQGLEAEDRDAARRGEAVEQELQAARARREALRESPEARRLADAEQALATTAATATRAQAAFQGAQAERTRRAAELDRASSIAAAGREAVRD
ncbi:MAG: TIGR02680 family protein, partial [Candidatus Dormibacteraceae bacterium]